MIANSPHVAWGPADWRGTSPAELLASHLARPFNTARGYRADLHLFARWCGAASVEAAVAGLLDGGRGPAKRKLLAWLNAMREARLSGNTIRRRIAAVTSLFSLAADLDVIGWQIGRLPLPPAVRVRDCTGPSRATVERLFDLCRRRGDAKGKRDEALLALLYFEGLRAAEALSLRVVDLRLESSCKSVAIIGKRGQGRQEIGICQATARALIAWLAERGEKPGRLFVSCPRSRKVQRRTLGYEGLRGIVRTLGQAVEVRLRCHGLRHAAVSHLAMLTADSPTWGMGLSRHRDVRTWLLYHDAGIDHRAASEVLSRGQIVRVEPDEATFYG